MKFLTHREQNAGSMHVDSLNIERRPTLGSRFSVATRCGASGIRCDAALITIWSQCVLKMA